jgi:hypothetical protein
MQGVHKMGAGQVKRAAHATAGHPDGVFDRPVLTGAGAQVGQHLRADYRPLAAAARAQFRLGVHGSRSYQLFLRQSQL